MRLRTAPITTALIVGLLALVLGACGSRLEATATPAPAVSPTTALTDTPRPKPDTPIFIIDTGTSAIDYLATGALGIQFPGKFSLLASTISFLPAGDGYHVHADLTIDGNSITAVNGLVRDALRANLEVDKYPTGHFVGTSKDVVKPGKEAITVSVSGTLELHGQTHPIEMDITLTVKDGKLEGSAQTVIDLLDYAVRVPTAVMQSKVTFNASVVGQEEDGRNKVAAAATSDPTAAR